MRTFFYFVPDRNTLTPVQAAELGLAYAFERGIDCAQCPRGPGGQAGIVIAQQDSYEDGQLGYHADAQAWRQIPGSIVWVGYYKNQPPGPDDLARKQQLTGRWIECDDGRLWLAPIARTYSDRMEGDELKIYFSAKLPQRLDLAADGRWLAGDVTPRYAALWELNEAWVRISDKLPSEEDQRRFTYHGQNDAAVLCLQANYRLGRAEAALIGLLNDAVTLQILDCLIDLETLTALIKKKVSLMESRAALTPPAGSGSSAGPAASTPTTDPPAPTSPDSPPASPTPNPSTSTS